MHPPSPRVLRLPDDVAERGRRIESVFLLDADLIRPCCSDDITGEQRQNASGGGKWLVEGCRHIDALDWRRDGYLQPPAPGKPHYTVTASCGGREQHLTIVWT